MKKFLQIFALVISVFLVFSCSEKEEPTSTALDNDTENVEFASAPDNDTNQDKEEDELETIENSIAYTEGVEGDVLKITKNGKERLEEGSFLSVGDKIITLKESKVTIIFEDDSIIRLPASTTFTIEAVSGTGTKTILNKGSLWGRILKPVGSDSDFVITANDVSATVRGTSVFIETDEETGKTEVNVIDSYSDEGVVVKRGEEELVLQPEEKMTSDSNKKEEKIEKAGIKVSEVLKEKKFVRENTKEDLVYMLRVIERRKEEKTIDSKTLEKIETEWNNTVPKAEEVESFFENKEIVETLKEEKIATSTSNTEDSDIQEEIVSLIFKDEIITTVKSDVNQEKRADLIKDIVEQKFEGEKTTDIAQKALEKVEELQIEAPTKLLEKSKSVSRSLETSKTVKKKASVSKANREKKDKILEEKKKQEAIEAREAAIEEEKKAFIQAQKEKTIQEAQEKKAKILAEKKEQEEREAKAAALQAEKEAKDRQRKEAVLQAQREAEQQQKEKAALQAQREAEEQAKKEAALEAQRKAEEQAKKEAALEAQRKAEEQAKKENEEQQKEEVIAGEVPIEEEEEENTEEDPIKGTGSIVDTGTGVLVDIGEDEIGGSLDQSKDELLKKIAILRNEEKDLIALIQDSEGYLNISDLGKVTDDDYEIMKPYIALLKEHRENLEKLHNLSELEEKVKAVEKGEEISPILKRLDAILKYDESLHKKLQALKIQIIESRDEIRARVKAHEVVEEDKTNTDTTTDDSDKDDTSTGTGQTGDTDSDANSTETGTDDSDKGDASTGTGQTGDTDSDANNTETGTGANDSDKDKDETPVQEEVNNDEMILYTFFNLSAELQDEGHVNLNWNAPEGSINFQHYKLVRSFDNPNPVYPDDGAIKYSDQRSFTHYKDYDSQDGFNYYRICAISEEERRYCSSVVKLDNDLIERTAAEKIALEKEAEELEKQRAELDKLIQEANASVIDKEGSEIINDYAKQLNENQVDGIVQNANSTQTIPQVNEVRAEVKEKKSFFDKLKEKIKKIF